MGITSVHNDSVSQAISLEPTNTVSIENSITLNRQIPAGFLGITPGEWPLVAAAKCQRALTGVLSVSGSTVTGVGTLFRSELVKGSQLYNAANQLIGVVGSVVSDTSATLIALMFASQATDAIAYTSPAPTEDFTYSAVRTMDSVGTLNQFGTRGDFQWRSMHWKAASIVRVGTTVTVTIDVTYPNNLSSYRNVGEFVSIAGCVEAGFNGAYAITGNSGNTFTYTSATNGDATATTTGAMSIVYFGLFDKFVNTHYNNGSKIIFTLFGTPQWCTDTPTAVNHGYPNYPGGTSPINVTFGYPALVAFIIALHVRYGAKISFIEIWNEPSFNTDGTANGFYFNGTVGQLIPLIRLVKQVLLSNNSATKVISCATWSAGALANIKQILETSGGTSYDLNPTTYPSSKAITSNASITDVSVIPTSNTSSINSSHYGLSVLEQYPGATRKIELGTRLVSHIANTSITISKPCVGTLGNTTNFLIGVGADYADIIGVHTYHKQYTGDVFVQLTNLKDYLTAIDYAAKPIYSTEVGYLEAKGTETDQEYINNIGALMLESALAGCDLVVFYSFTHGTMGIANKPDVIDSLSRTFLASDGQTFTKALIKAADKTLTIT